VVASLGTPSGSPAAAQARTPVPADVLCANELGEGRDTTRRFCDVFIATTAADGVQIEIPPHRGDAVLRFDLHNRHLYSEQLVEAGRAYTRYTTTVAVATLENVVLGRGTVQSEFRTAADLLDRVMGGAGPSGLKAIAPIGNEPIVVTVPETITRVALVGESLRLDTLRGREQFVTAGRPIALVSNVTVEYRPAPTRRRRRP
jgi:hypothetical protein